MENMKLTLQQQICPVLPSHIANLLVQLPDTIVNKITEIRLRVNQPLLLVLDNSDMIVTQPGKTTDTEAYYCNSHDLSLTFQLLCKNSVYAFEEEVRQGYLTIPGGHRVGLTGQVIYFNGTVKTIKCISSLNFRLAKAIPGCADSILPHIVDRHCRRVLNTLLISPPRCGKTTILRDIIRQLSIGKPELGIWGLQIGVVDERSEIAACHNGIPSIDLGPRVDVLDACPKANGMLMLIRSMAPQILATDELGREEDALAVREAICAGVTVVATVHSRTFHELYARPYIGELLSQKLFERYVILSGRLGPGTIEEIYDSRYETVVYTCPNEVVICG